MIGRWFRERRRKGILKTPFPTGWIAWLERRVPHFDSLSPQEQGVLRSMVQIFVAEKEWEGCQGVEITDEIKVTIAGQACLLLLGLDHNYFYNVRNVLVFPQHYIPKHQTMDGQGVVHQSRQAVLGQASCDGPVVLSWISSREGGLNAHDGRNVVLHEFAHKLDFMDGFANGVPILRSRKNYGRWFKVMQREYEVLVARSESRKATLLDDYGATNPGEFFAVSVECFFEKPEPMRRQHEGLYHILSEYFGQDPAARLSSDR